MVDLSFHPADPPRTASPGHIHVALYDGPSTRGFPRVGGPVKEAVRRLGQCVDVRAFDLLTVALSATAADTFVCPSIYEPLGIVNLEAMACGTAVVASDVGGIPEVVVDGETGTLVHYDDNDVETFEREIAEQVNAMVADSERAKKFGVAGRDRAVDKFSWATIAQQTVDIYESLR